MILFKQAKTKTDDTRIVVTKLLVACITHSPLVAYSLIAGKSQSVDVTIGLYLAIFFFGSIFVCRPFKCEIAQFDA